jgi:uncharacterized NAD(P)/FAD-binding protein YdhS
VQNPKTAVLNSVSSAKRYSTNVDVAIIGGGFSGTILAVQLLRRAPSLRIGVIDKSSIPGRGLAYSTQYNCHLLNVPAGNMSALPEDPGHFLRWARANCGPAVHAESFVSRMAYGRYIGSLLEESAIQEGGHSLEWSQEAAVSLRRDNGVPVVLLKNGRELHAEVVILAIGNFPPGNPKASGLSGQRKKYVPFAWSPSALEGLDPNGSVLLIGSGLTSIDLTVALQARKFQGQIQIISRHGLVPQRHQAAEPWPQFWHQGSPRNIRGLMHLIRNQVRAAADQGVDWRSVINSLRPVAQDIWKSLPHEERARFLRHARPYWEAHRHRIAFEIHNVVSRLISEGRLTIYAGRITEYSEVSDHAVVTFRNRKDGSFRRLQVDRMINCTGSESDCRRIDDSLLTSLFLQGEARPDPLFLGLDVDSKGSVLNFNGVPSNSLFAIGPVKKGGLWETTAVPEIRKQASDLAEHVAHLLAYRRNSHHKNSVVEASV